MMGAIQFRLPTCIPAFLLAAQPKRTMPRLKKSGFTFLPEFAFKIEGAKPPRVDAKITSWGRFVQIRFRFGFGEIGHQGFSILGKVIGYRHEIFEGEHHVYRHIDHWIDERYANHDAIVCLQKTRCDQSFRSNGEFRQFLSLSDGIVSTPPSAAKSGEASSFTREGGAA